MVYNGAPNVGAHFNGYFYKYKSIVKFEGSLMSFIVGKKIPFFHHFLLYENINYHI
jgi:hypothetical protein